MSNKRIFCFGDSFTVGEGANLRLQREIESMFLDEKEGSRKSSSMVAEINKKLSWTQHLGDRFNVHVNNQGESGANNQRIFNRVFEFELELEGYRESDLVIIMWSSSIRNPLSWIPEVFSKASPVGAGWSLKELIGTQGPQAYTETYFDEYTTKEEQNYIKDSLTPFMKEYFELYLTELHSEEYYNMVNLNMIKFLQDYLSSKNVPYVMIDAFERMDSFKSKKDKKWDKLIDSSNYIGFGETTLWDELDKVGGDIWEDPELSYSPDGQRCHPNASGYKIAGKIIGDFIEKNIWKRTAI